MKTFKEKKKKKRSLPCREKTDRNLSLGELESLQLKKTNQKTLCPFSPTKPKFDYKQVDFSHNTDWHKKKEEDINIVLILNNLLGTHRSSDT